MSPLSELIRKTREEAGLSQAELSKKLGYSERAISRWENGKNIPHKVVCDDIADGLGLTREEVQQLRDADHNAIAANETAFDLLSSRVRNSHRKLDVSVLSAHNVDWLYVVDKVAADYETVIEEYHKAAGGSGANTCAALGQLSLLTKCIGICADDENGKFLKDDLQARGVDVADIVFVSSTEFGTGSTSIYTDRDGRRTIYLQSSVNDCFTMYFSELELGNRYAKTFQNSKVVHVSSFQESSIVRVQKEIASLLEPDQVFCFNPGALQAKYGVERLAPVLERTNVLFLYDLQLRDLLRRGGVEVTDEMGAPELIYEFYDWRERRNFSEPFMIVVKNSLELINQERYRDYLFVGDILDGRQPISRTDHLLVPTNYIRNFDATGAGDNCAAGIIAGLFEAGSLDECVEGGFAMALMASAQLGGRLPAHEKYRYGELLNSLLG